MCISLNIFGWFGNKFNEVKNFFSLFKLRILGIDLVFSMVMFRDLIKVIEIYLFLFFGLVNIFIGLIFREIFFKWCLRWLLENLVFVDLV